ncbi:Gfo/Idh/MocA family protein [Actinotalea caeni]|uniref:Gfo/Idh/MocA family protein n=1 Tax=Actinotalea caeni TaxID=1348467 RepID=UPI0012E12FAB|nr:Gfo/Idh/MocA family oxidoreductase [Actinotalea caeni]
MSRTRYGLVGAGSRAQMYVDAVAGPFVGHAELVAWADTNPGRLDVHEARLREAGRPAPARFAVDEVAAAVREHALDRVVVTSPDATHADHVVAVLEGGADAVVEKPLTTTVEGVRAIADAVERTGRSVVVTFNYRYSPRNGALRELLASGRIGEVTSVHFEWLLDTSHGADYFRRWHRDKQRSGGLLVHKASHHFDLVGWWLDDVATRVYCSGGLRFYGARNAAARGLVPRPARGTQDPPLRDPFALDLRDDPVLRALYLEQEHHDGYLRDQDPFSDPVSIEDNLALVVDYARGATMSYSLNAHAPWEGYTVAVNGTRGRAELSVVESGAVLLGPGGRPTAVVDHGPDAVAAVAGTPRPVAERLLVQEHFGTAEEVPIPAARGGHGGGDAQLLADLFQGVGDDPLHRSATWADGVRALAVGLAGNRSLATGGPVAVADLGLPVAPVR